MSSAPGPTALPVARVALLVALAHLDRDFDYAVPAELAEAAQPGARVRVRFAGRLVDGYVLARVGASEHTGTLARLEKVVSAEPVLTAEVAALARVVADRYAGTRADVLRLAVPPRHARTEAAAAEPVAWPEPAAPDRGRWRAYQHADAFLDALGSGGRPRAAWQALPGEDWADRLAELAAVTVTGGRRAVLLVPDQRDLDVLHAALVARLGDAAVVDLAASLGPAARYRRWLRARRGQAAVVVGTRAAVFAPLADLGLVVVWDDGDDSHAEPRAPYPHAREVAVLRAHAAHAAVVLAGHARTAEVAALVEQGWAHDLVAPRDTVRAAAPRVSALAQTDTDLARDPGARAARLPAIAFAAARSALEVGAAVLVQVPRSGYLPSLACARCRTPARCRRCAGPLALPSGPGADGAAASPRCRWCGTTEPAYRCPACASRVLRAQVVGATRTAEELGRAFAGVRVRTSGGDAVLARAEPGELVVATPGAEPAVEGGYGAALLLDGWALLGREDLRAGEETLRRWMAAAALVRPAARGGQVVVVAEADLAPVQSLLRWDPVGAAAAELASRAEVGFPPAASLAAVEGSAAVVEAVAAAVGAELAVTVLGPVEVAEGRERTLLRAPRSDGWRLAAALAHAQAARTARKDTDPVRVQVDPHEVG